MDFEYTGEVRGCCALAGCWCVVDAVHLQLARCWCMVDAVHETVAGVSLLGT